MPSPMDYFHSRKSRIIIGPELPCFPLRNIIISNNTAIKISRPKLAQSNLASVELSFSPAPSVASRHKFSTESGHGSVASTKPSPSKSRWYASHPSRLAVELSFESSQASNASTTPSLSVSR